MNAQAPRPDAHATAVTDTLYADLRRVAERVFASERKGHTLQPTAVVNEACIRLMAGGLPAAPREQQLAIASRVLRQVLIDHARAHNAEKRGGGAVRVSLERADPGYTPEVVDVEALTRAMERLRTLSERQAEVVTLRLLSGMTMEQIASVLDVSKRTVESDWTVGRAWLRRELTASCGGGAS